MGKAVSTAAPFIVCMSVNFLVTVCFDALVPLSCIHGLMGHGMALCGLWEHVNYVLWQAHSPSPFRISKTSKSN